MPDNARLFIEREGETVTIRVVPDDGSTPITMHLTVDRAMELLNDLLSVLVVQRARS